MGAGCCPEKSHSFFKKGQRVSNKDNRVRWGRVLCNPCPKPSGAANLALPESWEKTCFPRWGPVSWERPGPAPETPLLAGEICSPRSPVPPGGSDDPLLEVAWAAGRRASSRSPPGV